MSKEEVFNYIRKETLGKQDDNGQTKLTAQEILAKLDINQATLYKNLNGIRKWDEVQTEIYKVRRHKEGRKIVFEQEYWWITK